MGDNILGSFQTTAGSGNGSRPQGDIFDNLDNIRLTQDFAATLGVQKELLTIPLKKPSKEWWIRTHSSLRVQTCVLELKEDSEIYMVQQPLWPVLATESTFGPRMLIGSVSRQGTFFVWPIRLPGPDGKLDEWNESALKAAVMAETAWVRLAADRNLGAYQIFRSTAELPEPTWPDKPFNELLRIAFKQRVIDSLDHPVLRKLRGEV